MEPTMSRTVLFVLLCVAGCGRDAAPSVAPATTTIDRASLRLILQARHPEDLPGRAALLRHPGVVDALAEMARSDDHLMVRRRAALSLGHLAPIDPRAEQILVALATDAPEIEVRAAALTGLGLCDLEVRADLRRIVEAQATSPDVRLASAAVTALASAPSGKAVLLRVQANTAVPAPARRLAAERLGMPVTTPRAVAVRVP
jgi:hypothetical protein